MANYNGNYNDNKKGNRKPFNKRPSDIDAAAPLLMDGRSGRFTYNVESAEMALDKLIDNEVFSLIGIPVYTPNSFVFNDESKKGNRVIGYIDDINCTKSEDGTSTYIVNAKIYPSYADVYNAVMAESAVFHMRVRATSDLLKITQFEIAPEDYFK